MDSSVQDLIKSDNEKHVKSYGLDNVLSWSVQVARVLSYCHSIGIMHRDIKPSNILMSADKKLIKITDFGVSTEQKKNLQLYTGTLEYMAPELISADSTGNYDNKCDVFSLAVTIYEILYRRNPLEKLGNAATPDLVPLRKEELLQLPASEEELAPLDDIIRSGWASNPDERPSMEEMRVRLQMLCNDRKIVPGNVPMP